MTGLLTQVQESLEMINGELAFHRLEDIVRFVAAKTPTREEKASFLNRRLLNESIFRRPELQVIVFSPEANRWVYDHDDDSANLIGA
jgi:hypothetical protein